MAQWEYRVAYVDFRGRISIEGQEIVMDRGERRSAFVRAELNRLGNEGWELAGVHPLWPAETSYMVFKREGSGDTGHKSAPTEEAKPEPGAQGGTQGGAGAGEPTKKIDDQTTIV